MKEESRKYLTRAEALDTARQIMSENPSIHMSALQMCDLREREKVNVRKAISGHDVAGSLYGFLPCLLPDLTIVIHPAWHRVLVTALHVSFGPSAKHSIPSTGRAC